MQAIMWKPCTINRDKNQSASCWSQILPSFRPFEGGVVYKNEMKHPSTRTFTHMQAWVTEFCAKTITTTQSEWNQVFHHCPNNDDHLRQPWASSSENPSKQMAELHPTKPPTQVRMQPICIKTRRIFNSPLPSQSTIFPQVQRQHQGSNT